MEVEDIISLDMLYGTVSTLHIVWHNSLKIYVLIYIYFIMFLPRNPYECLTYSNKMIKMIMSYRWWTVVILFFIIWHSPRAGSMRRILCSDWLPDRARWSDTARLGLPVSFPQIKFRQSSSECTKVFSRWDFLWFLCLYGTRKSVNENENKENKIVDKF